MKSNELSDTIVRLMDVIKEQQKTIDKLSDKLIVLTDAKSYFDYKHVDDEPKPRMKQDDTYVDPDTVSAKDALEPRPTEPTIDGNTD